MLIVTIASAQLAQLNFTITEGASQIIEIYRHVETTTRVTAFLCVYSKQYKIAVLCWTCKNKTNIA
jgi:hypothetical protein